MPTIALVLSVMLLAVTPVTAQNEGPSGSRPRARDDRDTNRPSRGSADDEGSWRRRSARRAAPNLMFEAIDTDGDQTISSRELRKALGALKRLDLDGDGNITLDEVTPKRDPDGPGRFGGDQGRGPRDRSQMVARMMENDANGDGKLQPEEVPERMMGMLEGRDVNDDGAIDEEELVTAIEAMRDRRGGRRGEGRDGDPQQIIQQLMQDDRNGDSMLSAAEVSEESRRMLQGADLNEDGALNAREIAQAAQRIAQRGRRGARRGPGGGQGEEPRGGGDARPQRRPSE